MIILYFYLLLAVAVIPVLQIVQDIYTMIMEFIRDAW